MVFTGFEFLVQSTPVIVTPVIVTPGYYHHIAVSRIQLWSNPYKARVTLYRIAIGAEQSGVIFTPK